MLTSKVKGLIVYFIIQFSLFCESYPSKFIFKNLIPQNLFLRMLSLKFFNYCTF